MIQKFPRPINPKVKVQTDDQIAKVGQINQLIRDINNLNVGNTAYTGIPFQDYPPASLVNEGPKFTYNVTSDFPYNNGIVELISYHIKGIYPINSSGSGYEAYLCSVNIKMPDLMAPPVFPGSLTGIFQANIGNNIIVTPLGNGGILDVDGSGSMVGDFSFILQDYGTNPQPDGSYNYSLVSSASTASSGVVYGLMSYDFEMLIPNYVAAPTIFQD